MSPGDVVVRVGDMSLSGVCDTDVSGVDTMVAGAVRGCLCDLDCVTR